MISQDYEDLFKTLNAFRIKYLVVDAYAVMYYAEPRFTKDIDVWIIPQLNDSNKVFEALKRFGAPLKNLSPQDFLDRKMILQIGVPPVRIDILLSIPGVSYSRAWKNRRRVKFGSTPISILGRKELIDAKKKTGRLQDLIDVEKLTLKIRRKS